MASTVRYVNPASSGGDGTTSATSGSTAAYASLSAALTAEATDITGITPDIADETGASTIAFAIYCAGSTADTTAAAIDTGWVMDATHRLGIFGEQAGAKYDTSKYRLESGGNYTPCLYIQVAASVTLFDLQMSNSTARDYQAYAVRMYNDVSYDVRIVGGFYRQTDTSGSAAGNVIGWASTSAASDIRIMNATLVAAAGSPINTGHYGSVDCNYYLYNCTCVNRSGSNAVVTLTNGNAHLAIRVKNCVLQGSGSTNLTLTSATETVTNLTQDTTGTSGLQSKTLTFVDATNWDYHLASGDTDAIGAGTDLSADSYWPFSTDGDGGTRSSWDVGADEYSSGIASDGRPRWQNMTQVAKRALAAARV